MTAPLVAHLTDFVDELRRRGIVVGPSSLIDAASAMEVLDLLERPRLREGLATTLLVDHAHRGVFDRVFDLWFPVGAGMRTVTEDLPRDPDGELDIEAVRDALAEMLADDAAATDGRLDQAIAMIVDELGRYGSTKGEAFSAYQAISAVSPQTLIAKIAAAMASGGAGGEGPGAQIGARAGTEPRYRHAARAKANDLRAAIERETQRRMADRNGRDKVGAYAVPPLPENVNFLSAGAKEHVEIRKTIEPLARLLAAKLETRRRRSHRGAVDVRKTLRASMSTGGVPIELSHRKPRPGRPELIIICDVSGSVAGFSQFTLRLVYALRQQFSKVRVFAFVDTVDEVTDFFDHGEEDFGAAMHHMISTARISTRDGHSDYGNMLAGFVGEYGDSLTHRGALLVLGDARNNYHEPHIGALAELVERARHAYWLNPENSEHWGTGDSVATEYAEVIDMFECRNATQLGTVIADLLPI